LFNYLFIIIIIKVWLKPIGCYFLDPSAKADGN